MRAIFIYDFSIIFHILEVDVIRMLVNTNTLGLSGYTINDLKLIWLKDRLDRMMFMPFHHPTKDETMRYALRNLSHELDTPLYRTIIIPQEFWSLPPELEIRGNDLYISFNTHP